jgi:hypothetical protein
MLARLKGKQGLPAPSNILLPSDRPRNSRERSNWLLGRKAREGILFEHQSMVAVSSTRGNRKDGTDGYCKKVGMSFIRAKKPAAQFARGGRVRDKLGVPSRRLHPEGSSYSFEVEAEIALMLMKPIEPIKDHNVSVLLESDVTHFRPAFGAFE